MEKKWVDIGIRIWKRDKIKLKWDKGFEILTTINSLIMNADEKLSNETTYLLG